MTTPNFGSQCADTILSTHFHSGRWEPLRFDSLAQQSFPPTIRALHYGRSVFEGMKAYRNDKGEVRVFRPDCNMRRFKRSSNRLTLPDFGGHEVMALLD